jgi:hypothetical protein
LLRQDRETERVKKSAASEAERPPRLRRLVYAAAFGVLLYLVAGLATGVALGTLVGLGMAPAPAAMEFLALVISIIAGLYGAYSGWARAPGSRRRTRRRGGP